MAINYEVEQGDCIYSIAFENGFFPDTIWNHPNNNKLKQQRKDPSVLLPGDIVFVPDIRLKEVSRPTEQLHKFRIKNTPKTLRIQLKYLDDPIANADYTVIVDDLKKTGKTDSKGWLVCSIPPNAKKAQISLGGGMEWEVMLGHLDPIDEMTGIQGRLAHLGFLEGEIDGNFSRETKQALKVFQLSQNLEPTGEIDARTKTLLKMLTGE